MSTLSIKILSIIIKREGCEQDEEKLEGIIEIKEQNTKTKVALSNMNLNKCLDIISESIVESADKQMLEHHKRVKGKLTIVEDYKNQEKVQ